MSPQCETSCISIHDCFISAPFVVQSIESGTRRTRYMNVCICITVSGTYPCPILSKHHQEKHKCKSKGDALCSGYPSVHIGRFFRLASSLLLNAFTDEAVTTSAGRSFHIFISLWLKVNLRRSGLDRSFHSFSGCPRSLEVSAIWKKRI